MSKEIELISLQNQIQTEQTDINFYQAENIRLQSDYDIGISRIQQLEQELVDVLHYKKNIMEQLEVAESCACGEGSRLDKIKLVRHGQLEGRFLERMQSRLSERQRKQAAAVDTIRENITEIKNKSQLIEDEIDDARMYALELDTLISTNQANIQAKKTQIAQLEGNIRMMT